jgi:hypothetical protein
VSSSDPLVDPCGSGRFVIQHFNAADQVADVFYTIEIRIRDFHDGEGLLHSAYVFKRQPVGECHDAPPIGPNALLHNQAIRSAVWRCFKIVRVLQERHCSPKKTRQKSLRHDIDAWADHYGAQLSPADGGCGLCSIVRRNRVSFCAPAVTGRATCGMETKRTVAEEMQKRG